MQELDCDVVATGLCFGEGPRVRGDELWLSDMHAQTVLRFAISGASLGPAEIMLEVPNKPSGLGWLPNGDLLVVSMRDRRVLRWDGNTLNVHADLGELATFDCNDMVVAEDGTAWVGHFGFDLHNQAPFQTTALIRVTADGEASIAADDLAFPNGCVITPDGRTLIAAESFGRALTAFDLEGTTLSGRRTWATLTDGLAPDGICLDVEGGVWVASPTSNECVRVIEGGEITHRVGLDRGAFACALHGNTLFTLIAGSSDPEQCVANRDGQIVASAAPAAGTGSP